MTRPRGFTLLELLIALSIFAVMAVLAYSGLRTVLTARSQTDAQAERLAALQSAFLFIGRDVTQTLDRPIRSAMGDTLPPLIGGDGADPPLELSRGGWVNPGGTVRSALQRVGWRLQDRQLMRESWQVLDRAQDSVPYRSVLLGDVKALRLRFLDDDGNWQENWPPQLPGMRKPPALPRAVEVTLLLPDWGPVTRLFPIIDNVAPVTTAPAAQGPQNTQGATDAQQANHVND